MAVMKEFKTFIMRGNVVDLAVGVVIGGAFGAVVTAFVKDVLTPAIGLLINVQVTSWAFHKGNVPVVLYGDLLNALITFVIVAFAIFFFVVKPLNMLAAHQAAKRGPGPVTEKTCPFCKSSIPVEATRCAFCTSEVPVSVS